LFVHRVHNDDTAMSDMDVDTPRDNTPRAHAPRAVVTTPSGPLRYPEIEGYRLGEEIGGGGFSK
jgi:hypothetical protein